MASSSFLFLGLSGVHAHGGRRDVHVPFESAKGQPKVQLLPPSRGTYSKYLQVKHVPLYSSMYIPYRTFYALHATEVPSTYLPTYLPTSQPCVWV